MSSRGFNGENRPRVAFLDEHAATDAEDVDPLHHHRAGTEMTEVTAIDTTPASWEPATTSTTTTSTLRPNEQIHRSISDLNGKASQEKYITGGSEDLGSVVQSEDDAASVQTYSDTASHSGSHATGSSSGAIWAGTGMRTTIFDKVPMLYYMLLLLGVPVLIIVGTQATVMSEAQHAINFFHDHKPLVAAAIHCTDELRHEWVLSSEYLENNSTYADNVTIAALYHKLVDVHHHADEDCGELHNDVFKSELPHSVADRIRVGMQTLASTRSRILDRQIDSTAARKAVSTALHEMMTVFTALRHEPALKDMQTKIEQLYFARVWENNIALIEAIGVSALLDIHRHLPIPDRITGELQGASSTYEQALDTFLAIADEDGLSYYNVISSGPQHWRLLMDEIVDSSEQIKELQKITLEKWEEEFEEVLEHMEEEGYHLIETLDEAKALHAEVNSAAGSMTGSILACAVATVFVIFMQRRFQKRMDIGLNRSKELNRGVQKFVPRNQLKMMGVRSITEVESGDHVEVASTMLFSDIRDFTTISEKMSRGELFDWLQSYFASMTQVVERNHGYVDKFIGDALFCVFSNPNNAVRCGIDMQRSVEQLNAQLVADGKEDLVFIGVGIHHGIVAAGVFGDDSRLASTLVSSDVNLASRLEGVTKGYGAKIVVSEAVHERMDVDTIAARYLGELQVQGSKESVRIYEVFQNDEPGLKRLKMKTKAEFEAALLMRPERPAEALRAIEHLLDVDLQENGRYCDAAIVAKVRQWRSHAGSAVDRFSKRGSMDQNDDSLNEAPTSLLTTPKAPFALTQLPPTSFRMPEASTAAGLPRLPSQVGGAEKDPEPLHYQTTPPTPSAQVRRQKVPSPRRKTSSIDDPPTLPEIFTGDTAKQHSSTSSTPSNSSGHRNSE